MPKREYRIVPNNLGGRGYYVEVRYCPDAPDYMHGRTDWCEVAWFSENRQTSEMAAQRAVMLVRALEAEDGK